MKEIIITGLKIVAEAGRTYMGGGFLWLLFFGAFVFMFFYGRKRGIFAFLPWYSGVMMLVLINPLIAYVLSKLALEGVYWRMLWLLPMYAFIAWMGAEGYGLIKKEKIKFLAPLAVSAAIIVCGHFIYNEDCFAKATNAMNVPDKIIELNESGLLTPGDVCLGDDEIIEWFRIVNPKIKLPYGRSELVGDAGKNKKKLQKLVAKKIYKTDKIVKKAEKFGVNIIAVPKGKSLSTPLESFGFTKLGETGDYEIYGKEKSTS